MDLHQEIYNSAFLHLPVFVYRTILRSAAPKQRHTTILKAMLRSIMHRCHEHSYNNRNSSNVPTKMQLFEIQLV